MTGCFGSDGLFFVLFLGQVLGRFFHLVSLLSTVMNTFVTFCHYFMIHVQAQFGSGKGLESIHKHMKINQLD